MAKSSINFQKTKSNSLEETTRKFEANYLLPRKIRKENEYWNCGKSDAEIFQEQLQIAKPKGGRKPKLENSLWEAVLNLNKNHTLEDVRRVAEHIEQKFNIICSRIAIHRDEGKVFIRADGKRVVRYNYHAHLNFVTYKDGKQNWRRQLIKRKDLSNLQSEVAEILGMQRGTIGSTVVRANHRELRKNYDAIMKQRKQEQEPKKEQKEQGFFEKITNFRKLKQEVKQQKLTVGELKQQISDLRNELKKKNAELEAKNEQKVYTQADYIALNKLKKELNKNTLQDIYMEFLNLKQQLQMQPTPQTKIVYQEKIVYKEDTSKQDELENKLKIEREQTKKLKEDNNTLKEQNGSLKAILNNLAVFLKCEQDKILDTVKDLFKKQEKQEQEQEEVKDADNGTLQDFFDFIKEEAEQEEKQKREQQKQKKKKKKKKLTMKL